MKYINKRQEPIEFISWKKKNALYTSLKGLDKSILSNSLREEQGFICCYCERRIDKYNSHIEHFKPKSKFPSFELDYSNLLCSCQKHLKPGEPRHCGNSKGDWFDENLLISPLDTDCEQHFKYTFDGWILPSDSSNNKAITTIEKLQLNIPKLIDLRKNVIDTFLDESIASEDLNKFVENYLVEKEENNGYYYEFFTTIKYLFVDYS